MSSSDSDSSNPLIRDQPLFKPEASYASGFELYLDNGATIRVGTYFSALTHPHFPAPTGALMRTETRDGYVFTRSSQHATFTRDIPGLRGFRGGAPKPRLPRERFQYNMVAQPFFASAPELWYKDIASDMLVEASIEARIARARIFYAPLPGCFQVDALVESGLNLERRWVFFETQSDVVPKDTVLAKRPREEFLKPMTKAQLDIYSQRIVRYLRSSVFLSISSDEFMAAAAEIRKSVTQILL